MSDYIVLVKQVPDVSQITDNAFDPDTGTLLRSRLSSVINELDAKALAFAHHLKSISNDSAARIIALTMGPPMAEAVLRYSLARCADTTVLLTDKALGGADTWATANPLSFAIKKIAADILHKDTDYYIICGMQSIDGDTAQVPPQIAEHLQIPCIAYVTSAQFTNNHFEFTRIISGGSQTVSPKLIPAVITVADYEYPLFSTFSKTRWANKTDVICYSADNVKAESIGAKGSKTSVIRVFPPGKTTRKCQQIHHVYELVNILTQSFNTAQSKSTQVDRDQSHYILPKNRPDVLDRTFEGLSKELDDYKHLTQRLKDLGISDLSSIDQYAKEKLIAEASGRFHTRSLDDMLQGLKLTEPTFTGEVWVVAEHQDDTVHPATFELLGKARQLADSLETQTGVVLAGCDVKQFADELIFAGADNIYLLEHGLLEQFDPCSYRKVISDSIQHHQPQIVLFPATPQGRVLAPMVSYQCQCGLTADCTGLDIKDSSRRGLIAILLQTRPALGGNVMATICTKNSPCQMATARPGVMKAIPPDKSRAGRTIAEPVELNADDIGLNIIKTEKGKGTAKLDSEIIVSGGRGMQNQDNYERLIGSLCEALSNSLKARTEKGASRAAVEQGFAERIHQIGQTGTSVGPKLYIAIGISGAIQHMIGVANTDTIVAINSDPEAPIFKQCDYYIVSTAEKIIPELVKALQLQ
ncbi:MAG: FAD-binding protein [Phycisphaerales bacterium]|jgi:electron transfer flavoprotein alpha subunit